jgi:arrestin-related trafficking adapter 9
MISSTLTRPFRPTTINPTFSCERQISFADDIDIASLLQPKPRIITLEPIVRRAKTRSRRKTQSPRESDPQSHSGATDVSGRSHSSSGNGETDRPRSPVMSEFSYDDSAQSSGEPPSAADSNPQSTRTNGSRSQPSQRPTGQRRPITASIEMSRAGFLRGDNIDIKIQVNHTKQVKSLHGIIVTLYRQARVDMHPALPLVTGRGDDDVYPKSRTGLGGLSLSSSGSCHLFRKDLDQSFASLIVNPETLFAEIKTAVRVPEDCFPTVSTVPGAMISFKYHVEVILDLQGKLTGLDKALPTPGTSGGAAMFRAGGGFPAPAGMFAPWGGHCINTADIRREKSVVSSNFEIVIGTRDSERSGQWRDFPISSDNTITDNREQSHSGRDIPEADQYAQHTYPGSTSYRGDSADPHRQSRSQETSPRVPDYEGPPRTAFPLPNMSDEGVLSEKERVRRHEQRLLPSRPPNEAESSSSASHAPTAPALPDLQALSRYPVPNGTNFGMPSAPQDLPSAPYMETAGSSAPAYDQHTPPPVPTTDDKEETQRRNLEAERSAPDTIPESSAMAETGPSAPPHASSTHDFSPSAPVLSDDDAFGFDAPESQHSLPKYER